VEVLFKADPRIQAVGIARQGAGYEFRAVRNVAKAVPFHQIHAVSDIARIPVSYADAAEDPAPQARIPIVRPHAGALPEQLRQRPLVCGLQIQNYDDDVRTGTLGKGLMTIGTLGCFARLPDQSVGLLSNNHVIAGENAGARGADRILQAGGGTITAAEHVATLYDYVALKDSPPGATPATGGVTYNDVDAAIATLCAGISWAQAYLSYHVGLPSPAGTADPQGSEKVFKVGRTTGLTWGVVKQIGTVVGPIGYGIGPCWFSGSFVVEGQYGVPFSAPGDSGSAVVEETTGRVLGLLYAGNATQTYCCPINKVLQALGCTLA
jgi:hypothetical protein